MNKSVCFLSLLLFLFYLRIFEQNENTILIKTKNSFLILTSDKNLELYENYFGERLKSNQDYFKIKPKGDSAYSTYANENPFTPAIRITHAEGNDILPYCSSHTIWTGVVPDYSIKKAQNIFINLFKKENLDIGISGVKIDKCDGYDKWVWLDVATFPSEIEAEQMRQTYGLFLKRLFAEFYRKKMKELTDLFAHQKRALNHYISSSIMIFLQKELFTGLFIFYN